MIREERTVSDQDNCSWACAEAHTYGPGCMAVTGPRRAVYAPGQASVSWDQAVERPVHPAGPPSYRQTYAPPADPPIQDPDRGRTFLRMSGGMLALAIAAVVLLCVIAPVGLCLIGMFGAAVSPSPTVTP